MVPQAANSLQRYMNYFVWSHVRSVKRAHLSHPVYNKIELQKIELIGYVKTKEQKPNKIGYVKAKEQKPNKKGNVKTKRKVKRIAKKDKKDRQNHLLLLRNYARCETVASDYEKNVRRRRIFQLELKTPFIHLCYEEHNNTDARSYSLIYVVCI